MLVSFGRRQTDVAQQLARAVVLDLDPERRWLSLVTLQAPLPPGSPPLRAQSSVIVTTTSPSANGPASSATPRRRPRSSVVSLITTTSSRPATKGGASRTVPDHR